MDIFCFSARKTLESDKGWVWIPSLHSMSGENLWWSNKGFRDKEEAISFLKRNLEEIKKNYF